MDVFWTLPPVTRTITAAAVAISALGYAGIISLSQFVFFHPYVFTVKALPQIWRLVTAFFITKPKMGIALDPYFRASSIAVHQTPPLTMIHSVPVR
jgi:Derlin-2/3